MKVYVVEFKDPHDLLTSCEILGTYSTTTRAEAAIATAVENDRSLYLRSSFRAEQQVLNYRVREYEIDDGDNGWEDLSSIDKDIIFEFFDLLGSKHTLIEMVCETYLTRQDFQDIINDYVAARETD